MPTNCAKCRLRLEEPGLGVEFYHDLEDPSILICFHCFREQEPAINDEAPSQEKFLPGSKGQYAKKVRPFKKTRRIKPEYKRYPS